MKKTIFILLQILLLTNLLYSMETKRSFNPIIFEKETLPNGLDVIYNVDKTAPIVATVMHYKVGSKDETRNKTGYAHFFEHLMFEATENIPRAYIDKYIQEASGTLNAHTSFDETVYFFQLPANEIKLALWIESERMRKLRVDSIGVETQRGVVLEELKMRYMNQPYGTFLQKACENLFAGSNYGWSVIGLAEDIEKATIDDFKNFYDNFYQPNNATLVISGDIDIDSTKLWVRQYFGRYEAQEIKRDSFVLPEMTNSYRETIIDEKAQIPAIFICFRAPNLLNEDYYALSLLSEILSSGNSSRLYQRLVDKEQLAASVSIIPLILQHSGALIFIAFASPGKSIEKIEKVFYDELEKIIKDGVTEKELIKAKNIVESDFVFDKKSVLGKAKTLAQYNSYFNDPNLINTELDKYLKVSQEDIIKVANKYLKTDKKVTLIYLPKTAN